ncbi:MAG: hypothetical protein Q9201_003308 [Fulgogasparrea decipioides]
MKSGRPTAANAKSSSKRKESRTTSHVASWEAMTTDEQEDYALKNDTMQTDFLDQSLRDDAFGMLTAESLGEDKGINRRLAPTIDTSSMPGTLEDFSASDASSFSVGEHLDFLNPLETSNMATTGTNGGLHFFSAQYPIDFGPFIQDYHQLSQQAHDIDPQNLTGSLPGDASHGSNGVFPDESRTPARTSSDTRLSEAALKTPQRSRPNNHHAKSLSAGQSVHSQTKSGDEMDCDISGDLSFTMPRSKSRSETKPSSLPCPPAPSQDIRHRRMQELSDLGMTLYAQILETASPASSTNPPKSSPQPPFALAGKVLSGSIKFLHLLTSLYSTCPSVASSPTTNETLDKRKLSNSTEDETISHYSPSSSFSDLNVTASSFSRGSVETECNSPLLPVGAQSKHRHSRSASKRQHQRKRTRSPSQLSHPTSGSVTDWQVGAGEELGAERHQPADVTEVFALLTCYIRLLQLHSLLYARMTEFLTSFSQEMSSFSSTSNQAGVSAAQGCPSGHSSAPNLSSLGATFSASRDGVMDGTSSSQKSRETPAPLFPGLCLNGVCLDNFANFQIKFLLQITAHTLGEIECMLGLPEGYRVSRRDSTFGANGAANGIAEDGYQGRRGILDTGCVSKGFIEMTMESTGTGTGTGTGSGVGDKLMSIRDHLVKLRKLLKGTINP